MPNQVKFCFKHLRILWAIAILVMAGGQFAHAYQDLKCVATHAAQEQSSVPDKQDCPANHACCCHAHSHGIATLVEVPSFFHLSLGSSSFSTCNESYIEGPCREIDYPPQLSLRFAGAVRPRFAPYRAFRPFLPSITLGISSTVGEAPASGDTIASSQQHLATYPEVRVAELASKPTISRAISSASNFITIGSTKSDVVRIQGTPTKIADLSFINQEMWNYGYYNRITFKNGRVSEWNNSDGKLKVRMEFE